MTDFVDTTVSAVSDMLDLSRLPAPTVIDQIAFEDILAEMKADLQARLPTFDTFIDTDPAIKVLEVAAYREVLLRQQFNDRAKGLMLAYAAGSDLDHLAALMGVQRLTITPADPSTNTPALMESDDALRQRVVLAPDAYSVAGPELAYVFHARSANGDVLDASCTSPNPGEVVVTVLSRIGDGTASEDVLQAVEASVNSDTVRPLTDLVTVQSVSPIPFTVDAQIFTYHGPDPNIIVASAVAKLNTWLAANHLIGRDITFSGLNAALYVDGVQRVVFNTPTDTIAVDPTQVAYCTGINVTFGGYDN